MGSRNGDCYRREKQKQKRQRYKKIGSFFFYKIINLISDTQIVPQSTDFRLLDRMVIQEFNKLTHN